MDDSGKTMEHVGIMVIVRGRGLLVGYYMIYFAQVFENYGHTQSFGPTLESKWKKPNKAVLKAGSPLLVNRRWKPQNPSVSPGFNVLHSASIPHSVSLLVALHNALARDTGQGRRQGQVGVRARR